MVGMMRAHMADPHIVRKLEAGQADRIRACVGASYCINRLYLGLDSLCIQNLATGREETIPQLIAPSAGPRRRVVVVGAGPAGLEAARVAAERGHEVTLLEAAREPGGQVRLAAQSHAPAGGPDGHRRLARRRMPAARGRPPVRHRGRRPRHRRARARRRDRRDRRPAPTPRASPRARTWSSAPGTSSAGQRHRPAARCSCSTTTAPKRRCHAPSGWSPPDPRSRSCRPIATSARRSPGRPTRPISRPSTSTASG